MTFQNLTHSAQEALLLLYSQFRMEPIVLTQAWVLPFIKGIMEHTFPGFIEALRESDGAS